MREADAHGRWREIAPDVFWLPNCLGREEPGGWMHIHASCFLVVGPSATLLVDTGHPARWDTISGTLDELLGARSLDYVFPTHTEIPHAGNLARLLRKYPRAGVVGDTRDLHLFHPTLVDRFDTRAAGDLLPLGGRSRFEFTEAAIRDLPNTLWGYLEPAAVLFVSDGFMVSHRADGDEPVHDPHECLLTTAELPWPPDPAQVTFVTERSIYWMRYANPGESIRRMRDAISSRVTRLIAPTHGNVVANPAELLEVADEAWRRIAAPP